MHMLIPAQLFCMILEQFFPWPWNAWDVFKMRNFRSDVSLACSFFCFCSVIRQIWGKISIYTHSTWMCCNGGGKNNSQQAQFHTNSKMFWKKIKPWDWNIYLHWSHQFMPFHVGKHSNPMDHLGSTNIFKLFSCQDRPFDVMGFQECESGLRVLEPVPWHPRGKCEDCLLLLL